MLNTNFRDDDHHLTPDESVVLVERAANHMVRSAFRTLVTLITAGTDRFGTLQ